MGYVSLYLAAEPGDEGDRRVGEEMLVWSRAVDGVDVGVRWRGEEGRLRTRGKVPWGEKGEMGVVGVLYCSLISSSLFSDMVWPMSMPEKLEKVSSAGRRSGETRRVAE